MNCDFCNTLLSYSTPFARSRDKQYVMILRGVMATLKLDKDPHILGIVMYKMTHPDIDILATLEHLKNHNINISLPINSDIIKSSHPTYFQNLTVLIHIALFYFYDYCEIWPKESNHFLEEYSNGECTQLPSFRLLDRCSFNFKTTNKWYHFH